MPSERDAESITNSSYTESESSLESEEASIVESIPNSNRNLNPKSITSFYDYAAASRKGSVNLVDIFLQRKNSTRERAGGKSNLQNECPVAKQQQCACEGDSKYDIQSFSSVSFSVVESDSRVDDPSATSCESFLVETTKTKYFRIIEEHDRRRNCDNETCGICLERLRRRINKKKLKKYDSRNHSRNGVLPQSKHAKGEGGIKEVRSEYEKNLSPFEPKSTMEQDSGGGTGDEGNPKSFYGSDRYSESEREEDPNQDSTSYTDSRSTGSITASMSSDQTGKTSSKQPFKNTSKLPRHEIEPDSLREEEEHLEDDTDIDESLSDLELPCPKEKDLLFELTKFDQVERYFPLCLERVEIGQPIKKTILEHIQIPYHSLLLDPMLEQRSQVKCYDLQNILPKCVSGCCRLEISLTDNDSSVLDVACSSNKGIEQEIATGIVAALMDEIYLIENQKRLEDNHEFTIPLSNITKAIRQKGTDEMVIKDQKSTPPLMKLEITKDVSEMLEQSLATKRTSSWNFKSITESSLHEAKSSVLLQAVDYTGKSTSDLEMDNWSVPMVLSSRSVETLKKIFPKNVPITRVEGVEVNIIDPKDSNNRLIILPNEEAQSELFSGNITSTLVDKPPSAPPILNKGESFDSESIEISSCGEKEYSCLDKAMDKLISSESIEISTCGEKEYSCLDKAINKLTDTVANSEDNICESSNTFISIQSNELTLDITYQELLAILTKKRLREDTIHVEDKIYDEQKVTFTESDIKMILEMARNRSRVCSSDCQMAAAAYQSIDSDGLTLDITYQELLSLLMQENFNNGTKIKLQVKNDSNMAAALCHSSCQIECITSSNSDTTYQDILSSVLKKQGVQGTGAKLTPASSNASGLKSKISIDLDLKDPSFIEKLPSYEELLTMLIKQNLEEKLEPTKNNLKLISSDDVISILMKLKQAQEKLDDNPNGCDLDIISVSSDESKRQSSKLSLAKSNKTSTKSIPSKIPIKASSQSVRSGREKRVRPEVIGRVTIETQTSNNYSPVETQTSTNKNVQPVETQTSRPIKELIDESISNQLRKSKIPKAISKPKETSEVDDAKKQGDKIPLDSLSTDPRCEMPNRDDLLSIVLSYKNLILGNCQTETEKNPSKDAICPGCEIEITSMNYDSELSDNDLLQFIGDKRIFCREYNSRSDISCYLCHEKPSVLPREKQHKTDKITRPECCPRCQIKLTNQEQKLDGKNSETKNKEDKRESGGSDSQIRSEPNCICLKKSQKTNENFDVESSQIDPEKYSTISSKREYVCAEAKNEEPDKKPSCRCQEKSKEIIVKSKEQDNSSVESSNVLDPEKFSTLNSKETTKPDEVCESQLNSILPEKFSLPSVNEQTAEDQNCDTHPRYIQPEKFSVEISEEPKKVEEVCEEVTWPEKFSVTSNEEPTAEPIEADEVEKSNSIVPEQSSLEKNCGIQSNFSEPENFPVGTSEEPKPKVCRCLEKHLLQKSNEQKEITDTDLGKRDGKQNQTDETNPGSIGSFDYKIEKQSREEWISMSSSHVKKLDYSCTCHEEIHSLSTSQMDEISCHCRENWMSLYKSQVEKLSCTCRAEFLSGSMNQNEKPSCICCQDWLKSPVEEKESSKSHQFEVPSKESDSEACDVCLTEWLQQIEKIKNLSAMAAVANRDDTSCSKMSSNPSGISQSSNLKDISDELLSDTLTRTTDTDEGCTCRDQYEQMISGTSSNEVDEKMTQSSLEVDDDECSCPCEINAYDEFFFSRTPWGSTLDQATIGILRAMSIFLDGSNENDIDIGPDNSKTDTNNEEARAGDAIKRGIDFLRQQILGPTISESVITLFEGINYLTNAAYGVDLPYESHSCCPKRRKYYGEHNDATATSS